MDDKQIKQLLSGIKIPAPDEEAKNSSISNALEKFEKNIKNTQGVHKQTRLTDEGSIIEQFINLIKGNFMNTQWAKGLTFASVLAVSIFTAVTVYEQHGINKPVGDYYNPQIVKNTDSDTNLKSAIELQKAQEGGQAIPRNLAARGTVIQPPVLPAESSDVKEDASMNFAAERPALIEPETIAMQDRANNAVLAPPPSMPPVYDPGRNEIETEKQEARATGNLASKIAAPDRMKKAVLGAAQQNVLAPSSIAVREDRADKMIMNERSAPPHAVPPPLEAQVHQIYYPSLQPEISGDKFKHFESNQFINTADNSVSTFSIDVDKTSYSYVRRSINQGIIPQRDSVRLEEMVNYFDYDYPLPKSKETPFKPSIAVYPTPWNKNTKLIHIGVKGYDIGKNTKPRSNLVFLIDTSGSMASEDRLPLLKKAFKMMVDNLNPNDTVGIVTYAGSAGIALEPTKVADKAKIISALEGLDSGGSTAGEAGITSAYELAQKNFVSESVNRVILATDGDFNVGISDPEALKNLIEQKRDAGIYLSVLGFGQGNYNDDIMQSLAQNGNGNAAYIDNLNEARKVLVDEATATLFPIAKDVKIQVEFNPAKVKEYKLLGYETRALNREDFNNDKIDAGDVGSGSAVTAIYEIATTDNSYSSVDPLRYGAVEAKEKPAKTDSSFSGEYAFLKIRYKLPNESKSKLITQAIDEKLELGGTSTLNPELKFASSVAAFSMLLRNDISTSDISYKEIVKLAEEGRGADQFGNRQEFINLVKNAEYLKPNPPSLPQPLYTPGS